MTPFQEPSEEELRKKPRMEPTAWEIAQSEQDRADALAAEIFDPNVSDMEYFNKRAEALNIRKKKQE